VLKAAHLLLSKAQPLVGLSVAKTFPIDKVRPPAINAYNPFPRLSETSTTVLLCIATMIELLSCPMLCPMLPVSEPREARLCLWLDRSEYIRFHRIIIQVNISWSRLSLQSWPSDPSSSLFLSNHLRTSSCNLDSLRCIRACRSLMHCVQATLQYLVQVHVMALLRHCVLLWPWIFVRPLSRFVRDGNIRLRLTHLSSHLCLRLLYANLLPETLYFGHNHFPHLGHVLDDLEVEVERSWASGLIRGVVPDVEVPVLKSFLDRDTRRWVKGKHFVQKVQGVWVCLREEAVEWNLLHVG